ncbi:putative glycolipid-binding domain-containing protein [Hydrogenophaga sp. 2FB]|uniref:putative glycolipid-binding domain-containing protein n=1 Tax=Hydrogenophaga sp. 2FB TaxID=2502187 RepID=UPI0010F70EF7|nr:putative glycolipid-binding domain-containing protein [Hydrogenophaga sp. 2FB]
MRTLCWQPTWNPEHEGVGLEHLLLSDHAADAVVLAVDDIVGPFRLHYQLRWNGAWQLREADLTLATDSATRSLQLRTDSQGHWRDGDGHALEKLDGCLDIDIWPTPFTNSFPIRRAALAAGERREFRMAWVAAPALTVQPQPQAYTRLAERLYRFESLDGSGFEVDLPVDEDGVVLDYPGLFKRI